MAVPRGNRFPWNEKDRPYRSRDYCDTFDPPHWIEIHEGEDSSAEIGIRMITRMAKDIRYYNAYNSNNLMLYVEA